MLTTLTSLALLTAAEKAVTETRAELVALKAFSTSFKAAENSVGDRVRVAVFGKKTSAAFNKTTNNYAGGAKDVAGVDVILDQHIISGSTYDDIDFAECATDFWNGAGEAAGRAVAEGILTRAFGLITASNFSASTVLTEADAADLRKWTMLRAVADNADLNARQCYLLVNSTYFAYLLSLLDVSKYGGPEAIRNGDIPGLFGYAGVIDCPSLPNTGNLVGAIVHPSAIGIAGRILRANSPEAYSEVGYSVDEASGLPIGWRRFGNAATGQSHYAAEALFGAATLSGKGIVRILGAA